MFSHRSRNNISNSIELKNSFNLNSFRLEEKLFPKKLLLINLTEYADEARIIIQKNNSLKQIISLFKKNNSYTKNFINKIITINKDIKLKQNNNNNNLHLYKDNLFYFVKEYNEFIINNNNKLKEKIKNNEEKNEEYKNKLEKEIENLNIKLDENSNIKFMLENKKQFKDNIINILTENLNNIGCIQEIKRYRFLKDEMTQDEIDKCYLKHLSDFQQLLLNTTQNWNKYKNRAIKFQQEIQDITSLLENPQELEFIEKNEKNNKNLEKQNTINTENDLFFLTFDEFEDESEEITLETENNQKNGDTSNNINDNIGKNNNNIKFNEINNINNKNINNGKINNINLIKRDLYYIPQKDFSKSLIKNSESMKKIMSKEIKNLCPPLSNKDRNVSINSISKLNLKQIVFNKKNKYIKEKAKEIAINRFINENEYRRDIEDNLSENQKDIKLQNEIKEIKNKINNMKEKKEKNKKIIKEFNIFLKDMLKKYYMYIDKNNYKCDVENI